jgi:hypothetical protein
MSSPRPTYKLDSGDRGHHCEHNGTYATAQRK